MAKTKLIVQNRRAWRWVAAVLSIGLWFLLASQVAKAQEVRIPDFVLAQVLGRVPEREPSAPATPPMPRASVQDPSVQLVAHRIQQAFDDQLVAGVARPNVDLEVHFAWDSAEIQAASAPEIEAAAVVLNRHFPETRFRVAGFTDQSGEADYNMDLSQRRATAVWRALVEQHGVAAERLEKVGFGEGGEPNLDLPDTDRRRVELQLLRSGPPRPF